MNRRKFIRNTAPLITLPFLYNGIKISANPLPVKNKLLSANNDNILVLIQLAGGNDGLNSLIPLNQLSEYYKLRSNIAIEESKIIKINDNYGFHPSLKGLKTLNDEGKLFIANGVGYPNPNFSHFRSTDIWMTGSNSNEYLESGWIGRYLDFVYPIGTTDMPDPYSIQIGGTMSLALKGSEQNMGIALNDIDNDPMGFDLFSNDGSSSENYLKEINYLFKVYWESSHYLNEILAKTKNTSNKVTYPENFLARQLKIVSRLISAGLKTKIYMVTLGGFDMHSYQVQAGETDKGGHAELLSFLSESVLAFQNDLKLNGVDDKVATMTFSEFGRRAFSNASYGSDHGTSAPIFVIGNNVNPVLYGKYPDLNDLDNGNLKMTFDYRQVYGSVLNQWFNCDNSDIETLLFKKYQQIPVFKNGVGVEENSFNSVTISPNPASDYIDISLSPAGGGRGWTDTPFFKGGQGVSLEIFNIFGEKVEQTFLSVQCGQTGMSDPLKIDISNLAPGVYFIKIGDKFEKFVKI